MCSSSRAATTAFLAPPAGSLLQPLQGRAQGAACGQQHSSQARCIGVVGYRHLGPAVPLRRLNGHGEEPPHCAAPVLPNTTSKPHCEGWNECKKRHSHFGRCSDWARCGDVQIVARCRCAQRSATPRRAWLPTPSRQRALCSLSIITYCSLQALPVVGACQGPRRGRPEAGSAHQAAAPVSPADHAASNLEEQGDMCRQPLGLAGPSGHSLPPPRVSCAASPPVIQSGSTPGWLWSSRIGARPLATTCCRRHCRRRCRQRPCCCACHQPSGLCHQSRWALLLHVPL